MGNTPSAKRQSAAQKQQHHEQQIVVQNHTHRQIDIFQQSLDDHFRSGRIDRTTYLQTANAAERGKQLIDRGSKEFVKDDYIAILYKANPHQYTIPELQVMSCDELRRLIRLNTFGSSQHPTPPQHQPQYPQQHQYQPHQYQHQPQYQQLPPLPPTQYHPNQPQQHRHPPRVPRIQNGNTHHKHGHGQLVPYQNREVVVIE